MSSNRPPVKLAAVQMHVGEDFTRNLQRALEMIEMAAERGAQAVGWAALSIWPWPAISPDPDSARSIAWTADELSPIIEAAKRHHIVCIFPFLEKDDKGLYNSAAVIDSDGAVKGIYRKLHLPNIPFYREKELFKPGTEAPIYETSAGRIGLAICWDLLYPELTRSLVDRGAEWIFAPTSHAFANHLRWEAVLASAAFTNATYIARVNRIGHADGLDFYGESQCVGPDAEKLGRPMGMNDGIALWSLDFDKREETAKEWPIAESRRDDLWKRDQ